MPKNLSDTQRVLITNAAKRPSLRLLPPSKSLAKNAGTIGVSIKSMLKAGLVASVPAEQGDTVWNRQDGEDPVTLVITSAALAAVGIEPSPDLAKATPNKQQKVIAVIQSGSEPRDGTKLATLIGMLRRPAGATLVEIATVTNWQHHSIRGAISGALKKKLGLSVTSETTEDRGRVYRIALDEKPIGTTKRSTKKSTTHQGASS